MPSPIPNISIFTLSLFFLLSTSNANGVNDNTKSSSSSLIEQSCSSFSDSKFCSRVFKSYPKIVACKNFLDLSINIMTTGQSNTTVTYKYVQHQLQKPNLPSDFKNVLKQCNSSFFLGVATFRNALEEVRVEKDYQSASCDLKIASTDYINECGDAIAKSKIKDKTIVNGISYVQVFGLSAFQALSMLVGGSSMTSPSS